MDILPYVALLAILTALVLIRHWRRSDMLVHVALVTAVLVLAADPAGLPKPSWTEWREIEAARVHAAQYHPGEAIYVWTTGPPPRVYAFPWEPSKARAMQRALRRGGQAVIYLSGRRWDVKPIAPPELKAKGPDQ